MRRKQATVLEATGHRRGGRLPPERVRVTAAHPVLAMQQLAGNRAVASVLATHYSGTPQRMDEPDGIQSINHLRRRVSILGPIGLTQAIDAYTAPQLQVNVEAAPAPQSGFVARVAPTSSTDSEHNAYYPAAGRHRFGSIVRDGTRYESFYEVSPALSDSVRRGEQEHLNDHARAYELSYGRLTSVINRLAANSRGYAGHSEETAENAAMRAFRAGTWRAGMRGFTDPDRWQANLHALLRMSGRRDNRSWHTVQPGTSHRDGDIDVTPLVRGSEFAVGSHPSSSVITYAGMAEFRQ